MNKISICTVCGNRLRFLSKTLPVNIAENMHYPNVEFVVLDYNSTDGMENWIRQNMSRYIESGVLKYYKTTEPQYFDLSHSKNMVLKLATGNLICLVDADNFAGPDYVGWVNDIFTQQGDHTVITTLRKDHIPYKDQGGKLGFSSALLHSVKGFDESLVGYGIDDVDLVNRMEKLGASRWFIDQEKYLNFIGHSDVERLKNHRLINDLDHIFINTPKMEATYSRATVLYLLKQDRFYEVTYDFASTMKANWVETFGGWSVREDGQKSGMVRRVKGGLTLVYDDSTTREFREQGIGSMTSLDENTTDTWKEITRDNSLFYLIVKGYGECINRRIYLENDKENAPVNPTGWGKGTVCLNFDATHPIAVA